jgi:hypothetical protein
MKNLLPVLACALAIAAFPALAQEKKAPSEAQKKQQERMAACNKQAGDKKGEERKGFMKSCLSSGGDGPSAKQKAQQDKMAACNKQASAKAMKGEERKSFMSSCLKG